MIAILSTSQLLIMEPKGDRTSLPTVSAMMLMTTGPAVVVEEVQIQEPEASPITVPPIVFQVLLILLAAAFFWWLRRSGDGT